MGFPRNLGDLVVSVDKVTVGGPRTKTQAPGEASRARGSEFGMLGRYRRVKATKRGGKGGEESECLVRPMRQGNLPRRDPAEERRHRDYGTV